MFARFDENPAMTLQDIKKKVMDGRENSIPTTKFAGGIITLCHNRTLPSITSLLDLE